MTTQTRWHQRPSYRTSLAQPVLTFFFVDPSTRYKQYTTTAGMYIKMSATRTDNTQHEYIIIQNKSLIVDNIIIIL